MPRSADEWQNWLTEFSRGEHVEAWRGIMCFLRWLEIKAENGHPVPNILPAVEGDIFHSDLLRRMLSGKEPLDSPPPESFGKPWYDLVDSGRGTPTEVSPWEWAPEDRIVIDRSIWMILERKSADEYIVSYRLHQPRYHLTRQADGTWLLQRID